MRVKVVTRKIIFFKSQAEKERRIQSDLFVFKPKEKVSARGSSAFSNVDSPLLPQESSLERHADVDAVPYIVVQLNGTVA